MLSIPWWCAKALRSGLTVAWATCVGVSRNGCLFHCSYMIQSGTQARTPRNFQGLRVVAQFALVLLLSFRGQKMRSVLAKGLHPYLIILPTVPDCIPFASKFSPSANVFLQFAGDQRACFGAGRRPHAKFQCEIAGFLVCRSAGIITFTCWYLCCEVARSLRFGSSLHRFFAPMFRRPFHLDLVCRRPLCMKSHGLGEAAVRRAHSLQYMFSPTHNQAGSGFFCPAPSSPSGLRESLSSHGG